MANLTKAQLAARVLEHLGVKDANQSATATDEATVEEAIDAAYARLRKFGLVPFATSAIPEWAQQQLRDLVARDVAPSFGIGGERLSTIAGYGAEAERELARQVSGFKHPLPVRASYF